MPDDVAPSSHKRSFSPGASSFSNRSFRSALMSFGRRSLSEPKGEGELAAAFLSVISYCGSWTVDAESETITHHVSAATYPNWVNTSQARGCRLDGDTLELSTDEGCPPGCSSVIRWARQA